MNPSENNNYDEWFTMTYNVTTTNEPTNLFSYSSLDSIGTMKIDNKLVNIVCQYTFDTLGTHKVEILLKNTTRTGGFKFQNNFNLKEIIIPKSINRLDGNFLSNCSNIESITCLSMQAPDYYKYGTSPDFMGINTNGILYIPKDANYNSWMSTTSDLYTLGNYGWTVEYLND